ncbi:MAG: hypothetical protein F7C33_04425 [Desulfurococcales archaeon]|nr:hypothetical protein [Desulfurococcales archaeon]
MKPLPLGVLEAPGEVQMRVDKAFLYSNPKEPLVRIGVWDPPAVSIGRRQTPEGPLSPDRLSKKRLGLVQRPTGGLTILHDRGTLTVHLIAPKAILDAYGGIDQAGLALAEWIARALRQLGFNVSTWPEPPGRKRLVPRETSICLAYTGSADILLNGRKVGAGALRVTSTSILFQAVILIQRPDYELWAWVDNYPEPRELEEAFTGLDGILDYHKLLQLLAETTILDINT